MCKSVLVAMSGGVDSTYALLTLMKQGYEVTGVTFKINNNANTLKSIDDASKVAGIFKIKHIVVDYTDIFKKEVIQPFINIYESGKTPNPCVICNKTIKFGELNALRKKLNIDYIATGHYVNIEKSDENFYLKKAINKKKDQSYFLNQIPSDILQFCIFPLGNVQTKEYVRGVLADNNIDIFDKTDSQEICFIEDNNYVKFLEEYIHPNEGIIKNTNNEIVGKHRGTSFYTIGQRRGLGVSFSKPMFVKKIDTNKNEIIVGCEEDLYTNDIIIKNVNKFMNQLPLTGLTGKVRYRSKEFQIENLEESNGLIKVRFKEKQKSVTPGQYLVIYYGEYLVLGGEIT